MAYYGIYGSYLTTGTANRTPSPSRNPLPTSGHLSTNDCTSGPYLSPYPRTWKSPFSSNRPSVKDSTDRSPRLADYHNSYGWTAKSNYSHSYDDYSYLQKSGAGRRHQKSARPSSHTVWTDLSRRFPKVLRYSGKTAESYRNIATYNRSSIPDSSGGWRARLAQQGYVATTRRTIRQERKWHYLDEEEEGETEAGFECRTSRGTQPESDEQQHDSVISRTRKMQLQKITAEITHQEIGIQVDPADLKLYKDQEERRIARSFISSKFHSWYETVPINYKRYLSPMPWRGSGGYSSTRPSRTNDSPSDNKDFRKSPLNVDLPQTEAEIFAQKQANSRWRKAAEDNYCTSEDGSPSETGYDSSYTDADRSSCDTEGFFTDSLDRSYTHRSSERSTPFGEDATDASERSCMHLHSMQFGEDSTDMSCMDRHSMQLREDPTHDVPLNPGFKLDDLEIRRLAEKFGVSTDLNSDADADAVPYGDIIAENLCFRFKSLNEESSQRDSGFSEVYNQCDSPNFNNAQLDREIANLQLEKEDVLISGCSDIDQLLMDKDLDYTAFQTFEDFDRTIVV